MWDKIERRKVNSEYQEILKRFNDIEIQIAIATTEAKNSHKAFRDFEQEIKVANKKFENTLTGNGHPQDGLIYKVELNTNFRSFWERFGWLILAGFAGVPCTIVAGIALHVAKGN